MTGKTFNQKKEPTKKRLLKIFVTNLKKNTLALKELKSSIDINYHRNSYDKIIDITNNVNEKLDVVHKLRNDIKIFRTINTILTNHYIKETRDHENSIDGKIIKLEKQIKQSYDDLRKDISKMTDSVATEKKKKPDLLKNLASIENSNVFVVGNDIKCSQYNQLYIRNEIYNSIIKKIDKLFCGMVSLYHVVFYRLSFCQKKTLNRNFEIQV